MLIWDKGTRIFHWMLVLLVVGDALTGWMAPKWMLNWHVAFGAGIGMLLIWRIVWGVYGPGPSRFENFIRSPAAVLGHLRSVASGHPRWHAGHNPAGGWMIVALLITLTLILITGLIALAGEEKQGILAGWISYGVGHLCKEIHEGLVTLLFVLIPTHIAGVILESLLERENLIRSMITGKKRLTAIQTLPELQQAKPVHALIWNSGIALLLWVGYLGLGEHPAPLGHAPWSASAAGYAKACGECHWSFHPSLLPESSWQTMISTLDNHFGENASLSEDVRRQMDDLLRTNAAHAWDTKAANQLRRVSKEEPMRITAAPYWLKKHRHIPADSYASKSIGSKSNCPACHQDAESGHFTPQAIRNPKEKIA
ncbi:MAG: cytochrome b/b6 domain-containing protein [Magnetococcales bacterium]|nr:cytochrome b/b6 domain-containing protein [Magnetococcales bacterium]